MRLLTFIFLSSTLISGCSLTSLVSIQNQPCEYYQSTDETGSLGKLVELTVGGKVLDLFALTPANDSSDTIEPYYISFGTCKLNLYRDISEIKGTSSYYSEVILRNGEKLNIPTHKFNSLHVVSRYIENNENVDTYKTSLYSPSYSDSGQGWTHIKVTDEQLEPKALNEARTHLLTEIETRFKERKLLEEKLLAEQQERARIEQEKLLAEQQERARIEQEKLRKERIAQQQREKRKMEVLLSLDSQGTAFCKNGVLKYTSPPIIRSCGGIACPSHIPREVNGYMSVYLERYNSKNDTMKVIVNGWSAVNKIYYNSEPTFEGMPTTPGVHLYIPNASSWELCSERTPL
ncbi:hypothetical protein AAEU28_11850 [Pseudoalteromonas sp. SS15]|uniref:hypothetical protein n=1 Tax=Pseudoalteromonas sp. SS15 TaxID=3139393 RepID=UPI003BA908C8